MNRFALNECLVNIDFSRVLSKFNIKLAKLLKFFPFKFAFPLCECILKGSFILTQKRKRKRHGFQRSSQRIQFNVHMEQRQRLKKKIAFAFAFTQCKRTLDLDRKSTSTCAAGICDDDPCRTVSCGPITDGTCRAMQRKVFQPITLSANIAASHATLGF